MLASFDTHTFWEALTSGPYWKGALLALGLTCATMGTSVVIGFFLALGRGSRRSWVRSFVFFYNWLFRATPTLLQLLPDPPSYSLEASQQPIAARVNATLVELANHLGLDGALAERAPHPRTDLRGRPRSG